MKGRYKGNEVQLETSISGVQLYLLFYYYLLAMPNINWVPNSQTSFSFVFCAALWVETFL